jgi:acetyltransferase-like isoleucine patch superfamily enzyme
MSMWNEFLIRMLRGPLQRLMAEERNRFTHGEGDDPLYRYRVHGRLERLHIDPTAIVNNALFNVSGGEISIGEYAFFGHEVAVLTGTHDITKFGRERQTTFPRSGRDVVIEEGVWVASHAMVLGRCTSVSMRSSPLAPWCWRTSRPTPSSRAAPPR